MIFFIAAKMKQDFTSHILNNIPDIYYIIDVSNYKITQTNDPNYIQDTPCYTHIHALSEECSQHDSDCVISEIRSNKQDPRGIYDEQGNLTHIISFFAAEKKKKLHVVSHNIKIHDWGQIFDAISHPVFILNTEQTITYANKAALALGDKTSSKILEQKCYYVMHKSDSPPESCPFAKTIRKCKESHARMLVEAANKYFQITCSPILGKSGKIKYVIHIAQDVTEHVLSRQKIQDSEAKYRSLFNNHISGFALHEIICNEQGKPIDYRFLEVNPSFERLTGLQAKDVIGKRVLEVLPQTELNWIQTFGQVALEGKYTIIENYSEAIGKYFEVYAYQPKPGQFATIFNDVTQRKKAVRALTESENRLHTIIEHAPEAIYLLTLSGKIVKANQKASLETGYSISELQGFHMKDIDVQYAHVQTPEQVREILEQQEILTVETMHKAKNGGVFPVELRIGLINIHGERHFIVFASNITERLRHITELAIHTERLESLHRISQYKYVNSKDFLDFVLEEALKLLRSKFGFIYLYDEKTQQLRLNTWSKDVMPECAVVNPDTVYELDKTGLWGELIRQRKPLIENKYESGVSPYSKGTPKGHVPLRTFMGIPVFANEEIVAVVGLANKNAGYTDLDIKQLQVLMDGAWRILEKHELFKSLVEAKEKAEESNAIKTAFLANISHEIRTPMNAILGFAQLLHLDSLSSEERNHYISIIKQSGQQLLKVINDIIDIAKISAHALVPEKQVCIIPKIIKNSIEIIKQQQYLSLKSHIAIMIEPLDEILQDITIISDQVRIQQIFTNLISNAAKYTHQGEIRIGALPPKDGMITFFVKDTGMGIPAEKHDEIFGLFNQLQNDSNIEGTGIGLSIIKGLVTLLGGKVWLNSEVGIGSTFYFSLPHQANAVEQQTKKQLPSSHIYNFERYTIYIAEDEDASFELLQILLQETGIQITHAKNGKELVDLISQKPPDIVLLDINMPEMNGKEVIQWIRAQDISVPVIAQTAYSLPEDIRFLLDIGCTDHIAKPIMKYDLFEKIHKNLQT